MAGEEAAGGAAAGGRRGPLRAAGDAVRFLTILPLPGGGPLASGRLAPMLLCFPAVGALLAVLAAAGQALFLAAGVPLDVSDGLILVLLIVLTGGLHLDGFADTLDGALGGRDREERLRIMRDSRLGTYGIAGLICLLLLKFLCFNSLSLAAAGGAAGPVPAGLDLPLARRWGLLLLALPAGRWLMILGAALGPCARGDGLGRFFLGAARLRHFWGAAPLPLGLALFLFGWPGLALLGGAAALAGAAILALRRRLGGLTGDTLGALNELVEAGLFVAFATLRPGFAGGLWTILPG